MSIHLDDYHKAVEEWISKQLPWLKSFRSYPESSTALQTPCAFFQIESFELASVQPMTGKLAVTLQCEIIVVLGIDDPHYQFEVRNAAMALASKIHLARFGLEAREARFISASPDSFTPELDGYAAWTLTYEQDIEVGIDEYEPNFDDIIPHTVHVGFAPEIGAKHEEDYEQVMPAYGIEPK